ncbi:MAG: type II secretion system F family protein [Planctomycetota bacterium]
MRFECTYLEPDGRSASGVLEARNEQELHESLSQHGRLLIKASGAREAPEPRSRLEDHRIHPRSLLAFTQSMETSLEAGVGVLTTLEAIISQENDCQTKRVYENISRSVQRGESLAAALGAYPRSFNELYTSIVKAGEESGSLDQAFASLGTWIEWRQDLEATARQAAVYPAIVLSAAYGLILFLLSFVIPRLSVILEKVTDELPLPSRVLIGLSGFVAGHVWPVLALSVLAGLWLCHYARTDSGKRAVFARLEKLPFVSNVITNLNLAQACRSLSVLLGSGLPIVGALELTARSLPLDRLRRGFLRVREKLMEGTNLSQCCSEEAVLPPLALGMVRVGESSGTLPGTFGRLARQYDRAAKAAVQRAIGLLEPMITVFLGLVIGIVGAIVITTLYSAVGGLAR